MSKLLKYLNESKFAVFLIILLLILQAYCDLSLPSYTSDIVDIGIQQGGIENVAPDEMRQETFENLSLFLTDDEIKILQDNYKLNKNGNYVLNTSDKDTIEELNKLLGYSMLLVSELKVSKDETQNLDTIKTAFNAGIITKEQLIEMKNKVVEQMGEYSSSTISQMAVLFVRDEYETIGIDLGDYQTNYLIHKGLLMLGISIIAMIASIFVGMIASYTSAKIGLNLRNNVFKKVVSFSTAEIDKFSTASLITRSTNDIQQVQMVIVMLLRMVLYAPIIGIGGIIKVSNTKTNMGWIIVVAVCTIMALVSILMMIAMPKFKQMQVLVDRLNLVAREILTGIPVIRAFSREKFEEKRFEKANKDLMSTQLFTNRVMTFMMPAMMLIMNGISVLIVWFGGKGIDAGNLQVGDMMAFMTYTMQIVMAFLMITMISIMLPRAGVAANRIEEVINTETTINDKEVIKDNNKDNWNGIISFEDVSFRYPQAKEDTLEHLTFTAKPGQTTAIIGSTGCGKSTLIHLIPRFYDVTSGRITIDGIDIRELSQHKLRSLLGFVPQKGVLFSGDIESNIKFGGDYITDDMMKEAARIAQATEFIDIKPEHYKSGIAQGGTNVSGGQKQRLSIARAIAKRPKVFLFDDSFSALDYKTDVVLRKALSEKISDATVIIVAQRISTILHADQIIVLDEGKIAGIGTHQELLETCSAYLEIAKSQLSEAELKGGME